MQCAFAGLVPVQSALFGGCVVVWLCGCVWGGREAKMSGGSLDDHGVLVVVDLGAVMHQRPGGVGGDFGVDVGQVGAECSSGPGRGSRRS